MKNWVYLLTLLLVGCAGAVRMTADECKQVEELIGIRDYMVSFKDDRGKSYPPLYVIKQSAEKEYPFIGGELQVIGDTLHLFYQHLGVWVKEKFLIHDYEQFRTDRRDVIVKFTIDRPEAMCDKKKGKNVLVPFYMRIQNPKWISMKVDGTELIGKLGEADPW